MIECKISTFRKIIQWHPAHFKGNLALFSYKIVLKKNNTFLLGSKMKICLIETVLYIEIQLFYEIDFSNLTLKKSVLFSNNCHNFVTNSYSVQRNPNFWTSKGHLDLQFFSPVSRHLREAIKPHLAASLAKTLEGVTGVYHFSLNSFKNRKNLS